MNVIRIFTSILCLVCNRTAAQAALARIEGHKQYDSAPFNTSLAAIRAQVQRELEAERKAKADFEKLSIGDQELRAEPKVLTDESNLNLAAQGVYFRCTFYSNIFINTTELHV